MKRRAFTLIEVLIVIAIIGILVAMLLPAVQAARESARNLQCKNHLKQLALATHSHLNAFEYFPTNGWGWWYVGDPDRGKNLKQPGGWPFNLLPFIEEENLYNLQRGKTGQAKKDAAAQMVGTPISTFYCPTRRSAEVYPMALDGYSYGSLSPGAAPKGAKVDYGGNGGTVFAHPLDAFPGNGTSSGPRNFTEGEDVSKWSVYLSTSNGIFYPASQIQAAHVRDGLTHTYLIGEKYLNPDSYATGQDGGDNESLYIGDNADIVRWGGSADGSQGGPPLQDRAGVSTYYLFGSAHIGVFNMSFCDGSVRGINYDIDPTTHERLSHRKDGQTVSLE